MRHARGLVSGREVDREGLKQSLLALQKHWSVKAEHRFEDIALHHRIEGFHVSKATCVRSVRNVLKRVWSAGDGGTD